jgi:hypothetical protein
MGLTNRQLDNPSTPGNIMSTSGSQNPPASETEALPEPSQSSQQPPPQQSTQPPPASSSSSAPAPTSEPEPTTQSESSTSEQPDSTTSSSRQPPPATTTSQPPVETSSSSSSREEATTSSQPTSATSEPSSSAEQTSSEESSESSRTSFITTISQTRTDQTGGTSVVVVTETKLPPAVSSTTSSGAPHSTGSSNLDSDNGSGGGLDKGATVAIGVVVPIVAIAILAIVGLFWWKKRRARMQAEEERRKEVEDYSYNPNADPTIPSVAMMSDSGHEMREDGSAGYRGWGTTVAGSTGRKASTTISNGIPYSDTTSPTYGNASEARSNEPLMDSPHSGEGEILGAMGPSAANNRGGDVHRGPSNASSSYSAAARSDGSDGPVGMAYGSGAGYYEPYNQNPYNDNSYGGSRPPEAQGTPVIRDNPARRNTRIENASHFPQGSVGISQNF